MVDLVNYIATVALGSPPVPRWLSPEPRSRGARLQSRLHPPHRRAVAGLLDSPYSLTEVRVMYEIAHRPGVMAAQLAEELGSTADT